MGELYLEHAGKVSDKWSLYVAAYDRLFAPYRERPVRLLEIGVQNGGSLELWGAFFPNAETIVGCDINASCASLEYEDPRIRLVVADANMEEAQQQILQHSSGFDLMIDDGSHRSGDIVRSFALYFPHLEHGGLYIIEDLHCSYWEEYTGGLFHPDSAILFLKKLVDVLNHEHWGIDKSRAEFFEDFQTRYGVGFQENLLRTIHSVEFLNSLCVIRKQPAPQNELGARIVTGTAASVAPGLHPLHGLLNYAPDQRQNRWAAQDSASELDLRRAEARGLEARIAELQRVVSEHEATFPRREATLAAVRAELGISQTELSTAQAELREVRAELNVARDGIKTVNSELSATRAALRSAEADLAAARQELVVANEALGRERAEAEQQIARAVRGREEIEAARMGAEQALIRYREEVAAIVSSTLWQSTYPLRVIGSKLPRPLRRALRQGARLVSRTMRSRALTSPVIETQRHVHSPEGMLPAPAGDIGAAATTPATNRQSLVPFAGASNLHWEIRKYTTRGTFYEDFAPVKTAARRAKLLAYYLPQFHAIPENDAWWGKGFTEWRNIARGAPRFIGHYQPRVPRDLGFYTLDDIDTLRRQTEMAKAAGLYGFVFYYYWFNGKKLLERPLERFLADPSIDMPFCLMWANENWTRRWDGSDTEILISQDYSPDEDEQLVEGFCRYFADRRYIRIGGRPLLMIYRASVIPNAKQKISRWRAIWREQFNEDPILIMAQSFHDLDPRPFRLDGAIEFPPHKLTQQIPDISGEIDRLDPEFSARVYRYADMVKASLNEPAPSFPLIRTVLPSWDNDARRQGHGVTVIGSTPAQYAAWLSATIERALEAPFFDEPFVCINAWNEWCEAAYLEPDVYFGSAYLNATGRAVAGRFSAADGVRLLLVGHDAFPSGAQMLLLNVGAYLRRYFGVNCEFLLLDGGALESEYRAVAPTVILGRGDSLARRIAEFREHGFNRALVNTSAAAPASETLARAGIASVVLIHELPGIIEQKNLGEGVRAAFRHARRIVFPSPVVQERVAKAFGLQTDDRCVVRPQGCYRQVSVSAEAAARIRRELRIAEGEPLVLGIGYADERKGFDLFLQLWRLLHAEQKRLHCCWVGGIDPDLERRLAEQVAEAQETGTFRRVGHRKDVDAFLSAADGLALTSREDPFPTVALEALAAGIPVFAFAESGGIPELLERREVGTAVPYCDVGEMARAIADSLRRGISDADRQRRQQLIREEFDYKQYPAALLQLAYPELMSVSVTVPNYNYAGYLRGRLESIFSQTYPVAEIVLLDDASKDDSIAVVRATAADADREVEIIENSSNSGSVFSQWRKAALRTKADYLWIAEADDLAEPEFLANVLPLFYGDPSIMLAFSDSQAIDAEGKPVWPNYKEYYATFEPNALNETQIYEGAEFVSRFLSVKNAILNVSAVIWRRAALLAALDRCEEELRTYKLAGDWRLYLEVLSRPGAKIAYHAAALNVHRRHSRSVTHALDAANHVEEVGRCQTAARRLFELQDIESRQTAYLAELAATLGGNGLKAAKSREIEARV